MLDLNPFQQHLFTGKQAKWLEESQQQVFKSLQQRSPEAIAAALDFVLFREYVCGMQTYPYMYVWMNELITGVDNRFLRGIAGDDTCILAPRGSAKSTFVLQWIAWIIGTHATVGISLKILYISYVVDVASSKSRQIKAIIESERYQEVFPAVRPSKSKWGESEWAIDFAHAGLSTIEEPYTLSCSGLSGAINSKRCLVGDTALTTNKGNVLIKDVDKYSDLKVLTYNLISNKKEYRKVLAKSSRVETHIYTIATYSKYSITCTYDHPVYVIGKGWVNAEHLQLDDILITADDVDVIKSISSINPNRQTVYDIEVEGTHNFFANGILVHNSHILLFDDLLKSPSEAKNKKIQDRMLDNYENIVKFTKHEGARSINLGTRMAKFDLYATAFIAANGWKVIKQSALIEKDGVEQTYSDQRVSTDTLLKERIADLESFLLQRQNEIPETSSIGIQPHHIKWGWMPSEFERIVIGLDTADSTEENSNATALLVIGIANDCLYVIDGWEGRNQGNLKKIDLIYDYWLKRKSSCKYPAILAVDWHSHSKQLEGDFRSYIEDLREDPDLDQDFETVIVEKVKSTGRGEKIDRIESHSYLFEKGRIIFNLAATRKSSIDDQPIMNKVISEITDHNNLDHNDLMDALEVAIYEARKYVSGALSVA